MFVFHSHVCVQRPPKVMRQSNQWNTLQTLPDQDLNHHSLSGQQLNDKSFKNMLGKFCWWSKFLMNGSGKNVHVACTFKCTGRCTDVCSYAILSICTSMCTLINRKIFQPYSLSYSPLDWRAPQVCQVAPQERNVNLHCLLPTEDADFVHARSDQQISQHRWDPSDQ